MSLVRKEKPIPKKHESKIFNFLDCRDDEIICVTIQEVLDADYGLYVWPSAPILAQYLIYQKAFVNGKHVVELGSGTALAGIVAAKCRAKLVTLTDHAGKAETLLNCQQTVTLNSDIANQVSICGLTWGHLNVTLESLRGCDLIIAADCFYDTKDFEPILVTVAYLFEANPMAEFWCTYQVRSADRSFEYLFEKWGLQCSHVHLEEFSEHIQVAYRQSECQPSHEIQMLIIKPAVTT